MFSPKLRPYERTVDRARVGEDGVGDAPPGPRPRRFGLLDRDDHREDTLRRPLSTHVAIMTIGYLVTLLPLLTLQKGMLVVAICLSHLLIGTNTVPLRHWRGPA